MFFLVVGLVAFLIGLGLWRWQRSGSRRFWKLVLGTLAVVSVAGAMVNLTGAGYLYWYRHRPQPEAVEETLYEGVTYVRDVRSEPRALVIHVVTVDLDSEGLSFLVTPGEATDEGELLATRTTAFLDTFDLQLAVNGDFYSPWDANDPRSYPGEGEPVDVRGFASSEGEVYSSGRRGLPSLFFSPDNEVSFEVPSGEVFNAISGDYIFLDEGVYRERQWYSSYHVQRHPRTVLGLDESGETLYVVAVDGRQPNYSEGVSLPELAEILAGYGAHTAMNLDGGGSTTLVAEGDDGEPVTLNVPIHSRIPGRERPVANHLGIYAAESGSAARVLSVN